MSKRKTGRTHVFTDLADFLEEAVEVRAGFPRLNLQHDLRPAG